jgi:hypothetical protein
VVLEVPRQWALVAQCHQVQAVALRPDVSTPRKAVHDPLPALVMVRRLRVPTLAVGPCLPPGTLVARRPRDLDGALAPRAPALMVRRECRDPSCPLTSGHEATAPATSLRPTVLLSPGQARWLTGLCLQLLLPPLQAAYPLFRARPARCLLRLTRLGINKSTAF